MMSLISPWSLQHLHGLYRVIKSLQLHWSPQHHHASSSARFLQPHPGPFSLTKVSSGLSGCTHVQRHTLKVFTGCTPVLCDPGVSHRCSPSMHSPVSTHMSATATQRNKNISQVCPFSVPGFFFYWEPQTGVAWMGWIFHPAFKLLLNYTPLGVPPPKPSL